jgi:hypothetical protein
MNAGRQDTGLKCPNKKKKGRTEKAGAATDASVKRTKSKCNHCGKSGHKEEDYWKKHPHKAPPRHSTEASSVATIRRGENDETQGATTCFIWLNHL